MHLNIAVLSTSTYACPPISYGGEIFFYDLSCGLAKLGHSVTLYAAPGSKPPEPSGSLKYMRGSYGNIAPSFEYEVYKMYKEEILRSDFIIDCAHSHAVAEQIAWFHREHKCKVFIVQNGVVTHTPRCDPWNIIVGSSIWKRLIVQGISQFKDTPWENSGLDSFMLKRFPEEEVHVIPWATNTEFYCPDPDAPYEKEDYLLFCGRPTPYKGLHTAIKLAEETKIPLKIFSSIAQIEHQFWRSYYIEMIDKAKAKGAKIELVEERIPFGYEQKRDLYRKAKALIFPYEHNEAFGLTIIESLACGTPVITSNLGAAPEIVKDGETGFLCKTLEAYEEAVNHVEALNPEACRKDAVERFNRTRIAQMYLDLVKKLQSK
ncbi:MAG: glycosyltransferase [Candidatus Bathyarchaeota archaeon]|nr:glycosyltransferase [Candidatus Bathyarchaeota archaeon]